MKLAAIICEYNPFHAGHARQFALTREALGVDCALVCLMSGAFVQRGEPAVFDRLIRARAALAAGADLVLENPVTNVLRSAEGYAAGSVQVLEALGGIDVLSFGCELSGAEDLLQTARLLESEAFPAALRPFLDRGESFAAARQHALEALGGDGSLLEKPNCILGVEYCKALLRQDSKMQPLVLRRGGDYHAQEVDAASPSATALRHRIAAGGDWLSAVPEAARAAYEEAQAHDWQQGERAVLAVLRRMSDEAFQALPHGTEGLWSRFARACRTQAGIPAILNAAKSKRYAMTRVQRLLCCAYLGISREMLERPAPYLRVLGFNARGQAALRKLRGTSALPVRNLGARAPDRDYARLEARCADLYTLCGGQPCYGMAESDRSIRI